MFDGIIINIQTMTMGHVLFIRSYTKTRGLVWKFGSILNLKSDKVKLKLNNVS